MDLWLDVSENFCSGCWVLPISNSRKVQSYLYISLRIFIVYFIVYFIKQKNTNVEKSSTPNELSQYRHSMFTVPDKISATDLSVAKHLYMWIRRWFSRLCFIVALIYVLRHLSALKERSLTALVEALASPRSSAGPMQFLISASIHRWRGFAGIFGCRQRRPSLWTSRICWWPNMKM